jgi:hypothetical protein
MEVSLDTSVSEKFWGQLQSPRVIPPGVILSPRVDLPPYTLRYSLGWFAPKTQIKAGSWVQVKDLIFECLTNPRKRLWDQQDFGEEVNILPVDDLYPLRCSIAQKGDPDNPVQDVPLAMWTPLEDTSDHGSYVTYLGYISAEYHDSVGINSEVRIGTRRFTVTREGLDVTNGIVQLTLKGTGRG